MRRIAVGSILCAILLTSAAAWGQDEFVPDHVFTGLSGGIWLADSSGLNKALEDAGYPALPGFSTMYGQESTAGLRDGPRLGFRVLYGSARSSAGERISKLGVTLGSGMIEWGFPRGPASSVALGLSVGAGGAVLTLVDHRPETFCDALVTPFRAELTRWLYTVEPSVSADGAPVGWLEIRLQLGYLFAFGRTWKASGAEFQDETGNLGGPIVEASFALHLECLTAPPSEGNEGVTD